jgi:hypothetical protein
MMNTVQKGEKSSKKPSEGRKYKPEREREWEKSASLEFIKINVLDKHNINISSFREERGEKFIMQSEEWRKRCGVKTKQLTSSFTTALLLFSLPRRCLSYSFFL